MVGYAEIDGQIPSKQYLQTMDALLINHAAYWAKINMNIAALLTENSLTTAMMAEFKTKFKERFPELIVEIAPVLFNIKITKLHQLSNKSLLIYYQRVVALMSRIRVKDKNRLSMKVISA